MKALINSGTNVNLVVVCGESSLMRSIRSHRWDEIEAPLKSGVDLDPKDKEGRNRLQIVSALSSAKLLRIPNCSKWSHHPKVEPCTSSSDAFLNKIMSDLNLHSFIIRLYIPFVSRTEQKSIQFRFFSSFVLRETRALSENMTEFVLHCGDQRWKIPQIVLNTRVFSNSILLRWASEASYRWSRRTLVSPVHHSLRSQTSVVVAQKLYHLITFQAYGLSNNCSYTPSELLTYKPYRSSGLPV